MGTEITWMTSLMSPSYMPMAMSYLMALMSSLSSSMLPMLWVTRSLGLATSICSFFCGHLC
jgi:hypothetical protein